MKQNRVKVNRKLWGYANRISELDNEIKMKNMLIKESDYPYRSVSIDGMPRGSAISDITYETNVLIERYQKEKLDSVHQKERELFDFEKYINPLKDQHKRIIRMRYLQSMRPLQVAMKLGYSEISIKKIIAASQDILD